MEYSKSYVAIPPGATIKEQIDIHEMTQKEFAHRMGMSEKHISNLINGEVEIKPALSLKLESVLGISSQFWLKLEAIYRCDLQKVKEERAMDAEYEVARKMPYKDMVALGWIKKESKRADKVRVLRQFFEVSNLNLLNDASFCVAYRVKDINDKNIWRLEAWVQKAKCEARKIETSPIDLRKLDKSINYIRSLTREKPSVFFQKLVDILRDCGIALVLVPHLNRAFLQGASFRVGKKIILSLSDRGKSLDIFWFSLFHELYHIKEGHFDLETGTTKEDEKAADYFAQNILISDEQFKKIQEYKRFDKKTIHKIAIEFEISPDILLGRLQKEGLVSYGKFADLKQDNTVLFRAHC